MNHLNGAHCTYLFGFVELKMRKSFCCCCSLLLFNIFLLNLCFSLRLCIQSKVTVKTKKIRKVRFEIYQLQNFSDKIIHNVWKLNSIYNLFGSCEYSSIIYLKSAAWSCNLLMADCSKPLNILTICFVHRYKRSRAALFLMYCHLFYGSWYQMLLSDNLISIKCGTKHKWLEFVQVNQRIDFVLMHHVLHHTNVDVLHHPIGIELKML